MKKLIQTLKHIWAIDELRNKIVVTLALVLTYRLGTQITLPGIDPNKIEAASAAAQGNGLLGIFDMFAGGAFSQASILALGIMPYISASIFMQLMTILVPQLQKIQKEGDSGRKKINQWTRYLTVIVTAFQAGAYVAYLNSPGYAPAIIAAYAPYFWFSTVITLTAGTLFVMWLGEKIQDKGLGNGTSIIIMVGILARLPQSFLGEFAAKQTKGGGGGQQPVRHTGATGKRDWRNASPRARSAARKRERTAAGAHRVGKRSAHVGTGPNRCAVVLAGRPRRAGCGKRDRHAGAGASPAH